MPETLIPNKLSFIWVGKPIPEIYAETIINWAILNPLYEIYLWTQTQNVPATIERLGTAFKKVIFTNGSEQIEVTDESKGVRQVMTCDHSKPVVVYIFSITALEHLVDPSLVYEELSEWRNYGSASDLLRISVLYNIGGIYMDVDTKPDGQASLPRNIRAPLGMLAASKNHNFKLLFYNPILASAAGNEQLKEIALKVEHNYREDYPLVHEGVRELSEQARKRLNEIGIAREILAKGTSSSWLSKWKAREKLSKNIVTPSFNRLKETFTSVVLADPSTPREFFSFQIQACYHPQIGSDQSWVK